MKKLSVLFLLAVSVCFGEVGHKLTREELINAMKLEYYCNETNYECASDFCWVRAKRVLKELTDTGVDLRGPDGKWGTSDDVAKQIVIKYPSGSRWSYHIAPVVSLEEGGKKIDYVLDAIGGKLEPFSPERWADRFGHGDKIEWDDVNKYPPSGVAYVGFVPGNQSYWLSGSTVDIYTDAGMADYARLCDRLRNTCNSDSSAYPADWKERRCEIEPVVRAHNKEKKIEIYAFHRDQERAKDEYLSRRTLQRGRAGNYATHGIGGE